MRFASCSRRLLALLAAVMLFGAAESRAADPGAWRQRADPVFRSVAFPAAMLGTTMAQADNGVLWLGTQSGLVRWDGYQFRTFSHDPDVPGSIPDSLITVLHKDSAGRMWIGTSAGGIARLDEQNNRFTTLGAGASGLSHVSIHAIVDDGEGGLWIGTDAGIDHLGADGVTVRRHADGMRAQGIPDGSVESLLVDRGGALWAGTRNGLYRRAHGRARFERVPLPAGDDTTPIVLRLMQDSSARIWVGTRYHGAFSIASGARVATPVGDASLHSDTVSSLLEVGVNEIWIGTDAAGIVRLDTASGLAQRVRHHDTITGSLADDDIFLLFRDRSGLVWVGTNTAISSCNATQDTVSTWLGYPGNEAGVSHVNVPAVLALPDETAWLSLGDGGIDIVDPSRGRIATLRPDPSRPRDALPKGRVLALARGPDGAIWLGTQQGLYRASADGSTLERIDVPGRKPTAGTWALLFDGDVLWLGGLDGLWGLRRDGAHAVTVTSREEGDTLGEQRVTSLSHAPANALWVGTRAGLVRFDPATRSMVRPPLDAPGRIGLQGGYITSVATDRRGRLWTASFGSGVRVTDPLSSGPWPAVHRITTREGLPHNGVNALLLDAHGNAWVSTDNGLARIDADSLTVTALHAADGVGIDTYWTNSASAAPSGALLFGGTGGLTIVDPTRLPAWGFRPPMLVTEVDGDAGSGPAARWARVDADGLTLEPHRRDMLVEFAALDYSSPPANRYAYRLTGFDSDWIATDSAHRQARYTNLPPGDYLLELRGSNRIGLWAEPLRWKIRVPPTWYETGWFRLLMLLLALLAIAGLVQGRTLVLRRRQRALQALVEERTAELERSTEELRRSEARLEQMAYYDGLTGLANRRLLNDELKRQREHARRGIPFTLLLLDLDEFKQINDVHGHDAGDAVLAAVAARITQAVRGIDRVARLGGDEFAVMIAGTGDRAAVDTICARIVAGLDAPLDHQGVALRASASIGVAACRAGIETVEELYKHADLALYEAKHAGRHRWCWHHGRPDTTPA